MVEYFFCELSGCGFKSRYSHLDKWINVLCDVYCREKISSNYIVVTDFKNKNVHLSHFYFLLSNFIYAFYLLNSTKSLSIGIGGNGVEGGRGWRNIG